ncbi:MAG: preprotein translocase subunit YajC [Ilumatobacteraceae bacterium]|jgi:preprotein translocase subunit YajC
MPSPLVSTFVQSAADSNDNAGGSFVFTLVFFGLIGAAMYFLMIRPQRRRMRQTADLQKSITEGDEILTTSGMYGFVTAMDGDTVWLSIADDVEVRVSRAAIARKVVEGGGEVAADDEGDSKSSS